MPIHTHIRQPWKQRASKACTKTSECTWIVDGTFPKWTEQQDRPRQGWYDYHYTRVLFRSSSCCETACVPVSACLLRDREPVSLYENKKTWTSSWPTWYSGLNRVCIYVRYDNEGNRTYSFFGGEGGMITNDVIYRNANREGDSSIDHFAIDLFCVQLGSLCFHDSVSKFA